MYALCVSNINPPRPQHSVGIYRIRLAEYIATQPPSYGGCVISQIPWGFISLRRFGKRRNLGATDCVLCTTPSTRRYGSLPRGAKRSQLAERISLRHQAEYHSAFGQNITCEHSEQISFRAREITRCASWAVSPRWQTDRVVPRLPRQERGLAL